MINLKKGVLSLAIAGGLFLGAGAFTNANAQGRRWEQHRNDNHQRREYRNDRNHDGINDRFETRRGRIDINRNGIPDRVERNRYYRNNRNYGYYNYGYPGYGYNNYGYNNGYYGYNNGYGYNSAEYQKGYRDGLDRGQEDARDHRRPTPNNSEHFRNGNSVYREGFSRGYNVGYNQYRRW